MDLFLRLDEPPHRKFLGQRMQMSLAQDQTFALWHRFMPLQIGLSKKAGSELYSLQVYANEDYFRNFNVNTAFEKWAAVPVTDFTEVPNGLEPFELPAGKYAVFLHRGTPADFPQTAAYIFEQWLPASEYELDQRPHFEVLGEAYKNNYPDSEEEIWIPVKSKPVNAAPAR